MKPKTGQIWMLKETKYICKLKYIKDSWFFGLWFDTQDISNAISLKEDNETMRYADRWILLKDNIKCEKCKIKA